MAFDWYKEKCEVCCGPRRYGAGRICRVCYLRRAAPRKIVRECKRAIADIGKRLGERRPGLRFKVKELK